MNSAPTSTANLQARHAPRPAASAIRSRASTPARARHCAASSSAAARPAGARAITIASILVRVANHGPETARLPPSPRGFKARCGAPLGLDYEFFFATSPRRPEVGLYTALNPNQRSHARGRSDFKYGNRTPFIQYLATQKWEAASAARRTWPRRRRAWQFWESTTWGSGLAILIFERAVKRFFAAAPPEPVEVEKDCRDSTAQRACSNASSARPSVRSAGDHLTIADFAIVSLRWPKPRSCRSKAIARSAAGWEAADLRRATTRAMPNREFGGQDGIRATHSPTNSGPGPNPRTRRRVGASPPRRRPAFDAC